MEREHMIMKVAFVQRILTEYRMRFFERFALNTGYEVVVHYSSPNIPGAPNSIVPPETAHAKYVYLPSTVHRIPLGHRDVYALRTSALVRAVLETQPDVVLCEGESNFLNNVSLLPSLVHHDIPYVYWGLGAVPNARESFARRLCMLFVSPMLKRASAVIGYSRHAVDYYVRHGASRDRAFWAPNSLDTDLVDLQMSRCRAMVPGVKKELGIGSERIILFVGKLEKPKRVDTLIAAMKCVVERGHEARLIVVGDGSERAALQNLARELLPCNRVLFVGQHIEDASAYFLIAHLFVLPGLGGLAIQHAMAHSLPVIASCADGTELDLVMDGSNGYLIPAGNCTSQGLANVIMLLLEDEETRRSMAVRSRELVERDFNVSTMIEAFCSAIDCATARKGHAM